MAKKQIKQSPLNTFVQHQRKALEESGKAVASLLPESFREHAGNALDEGRAGWSVLLEGVTNTVQDGLNKLRKKPKTVPEEKVKVEVE